MMPRYNLIAGAPAWGSLSHQKARSHFAVHFGHMPARRIANFLIALPCVQPTRNSWEKAS
jgi:hypothetical protein